MTQTFLIRVEGAETKLLPDLISEAVLDALDMEDIEVSKVSVSRASTPALNDDDWARAQGWIFDAQTGHWSPP